MRLGLVVLISTFTAATARAEWWPVDGDFEQGGAEVQVLARSADHLDLRLALPGFHSRAGEGDAEGYTWLEIPGEGALGNVGEPAIPVVARWIAVPTGAALTVELLDEEVVGFDVPRVAPDQPQAHRSRPTPAFAVLPRAYRSHRPLPEAPAILGAAAQIRGQSMVRLELHPLRYTPASSRLEAARWMEVRVHFEGGEALPRTDVPSFSRLFERTLLGYPTARDTAPPVPETMLIIAADEHLETIEPLVAWKTRRVTAVELLPMSDVGATPGDVRAVIEAQYAASDPPLTYVLLVGDDTTIPTLRIQASDYDGQGESDFLYTLVEGSDTLPDVLIGRLSARTAGDVEVMVNRIVRYERDVGRSDPDGWTVGATGIGSSGVGAHDADFVRVDRIITAMEEYGYTATDRYFEGQWSNPDEIVSSVNDGRGWVCFMGHGSGTSWHFDSDYDFSFGLEHIAQLDNVGMYPVVMDVACNNGDFTTLEPCFAEAWTRAGTPDAPHGAIAIYSSTISAAWDEPAEMEEGIAYAFLDDREAVLGEALVAGMLHMEAFFGATPTVEEVKQTFLNFGDPSVVIRSRIPDHPTVEHPVTVPLDRESITVTVLGEDDQPMADAVVAISESDQLLGVALSDAAGTATFDLDLEQAGWLDVVVTGFDLVTYEGQIEVEPGMGDDDDDDDTAGGDDDDDDDVLVDPAGEPLVEIGSACECHASGNRTSPAGWLAMIAALLFTIHTCWVRREGAAHPPP